MSEPIRLHPQPSISNPFETNPFTLLSDEELRDGIFAAGVRIDAAQHTIHSLSRELARRCTKEES